MSNRFPSFMLLAIGQLLVPGHPVATNINLDPIASWSE